MTTLANRPETVNLTPVPLSVVTRITTDDQGRFRLDGDHPARVIYVRDRHGNIFDLCAYLDGKPHEWFLREGEAVILGAQQLAGAETDQKPLALYPTPQSWLDSKGQGVCILQWDGIDLAALFSNVRALDLRHLDQRVAEIMRERVMSNFMAHLPVILGGGRGRRHVA